MEELFDDLAVTGIHFDARDHRDGFVHRKCIPWAIVVQPTAGHYIATGPDRSVRLDAGDVGLVAGGVPIAFAHHADRRGRMRSRWLHVRARWRGVIDPCALRATPHRIRGAAAAAIGALFDRAAAGGGDALHDRLGRLGLACAILAGALADAAPHPRADALLAGASRLAPWTAWLEANLRRPLAIGDLARAARLSPSRLHAVCRRWLGRAPMAHLKELRLAAAAHRLLVEGGAVAEVADAVGFANPFHFSREFARRFGVPPRRYRDEQRLAGS